MRVTVSRLDRVGPLVVVNTPEETALVLHFDDPLSPSLHDLTDTAADLILLALTDPVPLASATAGEFIEPAHVSLVRADALATGALVLAADVLYDRCFAAVVNPFIPEAKVLDMASVLTLIARGASIQIVAGHAAVAARHLDEELAELSDDS